MTAEVQRLFSDAIDSDLANALAGSPTRFRALLNHIPHLLWVSDTAGILSFMSGGWETYLGEVPHETLEPFISPDDLPHALSLWYECYRNAAAISIELRLRRRDGEFRWFLGRGNPIFDENGECVGFVGSFTDIDENKRSELAHSFLADLGERMRACADSEVLLNLVVASLGRHLNASRCYYAAIEGDAESLSIQQEYCDGASPMVGAHLRRRAGTVYDDLESGQTIVIDDCQNDPRTREMFADVQQPFGIRASVLVPIIRDGKHVASLVVHDGKGPRAWRENDIVLIETLAERSWLAFENARLVHASREQSRRQRVMMADILRSVTDGKLRLCNSASELPGRLPNDEGCVSLTTTFGLADLRDMIRQLAETRGVEKTRRYDLVTASGEAAMNAVVHTGAGFASVSWSDAAIQIRVEDSGGGIAEDMLPRATLERGFTTAGTLGQGFKMMLETVDRIWLLTGSSGTTVVLEQETGPAPPAGNLITQIEGLFS
ncbi:MAG: GAF domain-containing protein [Capsulimonadaceae bacterium]|nr:GAF domain-containing protein [Capsulimonadaceae bacterium]